MNTLSGPFWVRFESNLGALGFGSLLVRNGRISGGDGDFRYRGYVVSRGSVYRGRVLVERLQHDAISIFGRVACFEVEISGWATPTGLKFSGCVRGAEHLRLRFELIPAMRLAAE